MQDSDKLKKSVASLIEAGRKLEYDDFPKHPFSKGEYLSEPPEEWLAWTQRAMSLADKKLDPSSGPYDLISSGYSSRLVIRGNGRDTYDQIRGKVLKGLELFAAALIDDQHDELLPTSVEAAAMPPANDVFIGHGRSRIWKDLREFIEDRLSLHCDEFNREPTAGLSHKERLEQMLSRCGFAFLVFTAEDEHADNSMHPRENVIHESGLFQGKLGFTKAIILLEEGCSEFSNIHGLGQIRFSPNNIASAFEEIRRVLEREGLVLKSSKEPA